MTTNWEEQLRQKREEVRKELEILDNKRGRIDLEIRTLRDQEQALDVLLQQGSPSSDATTSLNLGSFHPQVGTKPPGILVLPDGTRHSIRTWKDILREVAKSLVETGKLTAGICPVRQTGASRYLVATSPRHPGGNDFFEPYALPDGLWLETHAGATMLTFQAAFLLRLTGQDPDLYKLE